MLHFKTFRTRSIGWSLYGLNFRPLQEIETIMGGGGYLRVVQCCLQMSQNNPGCLTNSVFKPDIYQDV